MSTGTTPSPLRISVVVPTYDRGPALSDTLNALLACTVPDGRGELIVVDDGSRVPVDVGSLAQPDHLSLRVLRQANRGPAAARNAGFRVATADLVLFVDDDILVPPTLIEQHIAAHRQLGTAVVFGRCVLRPDRGEEMLHGFLESLGNDPGRDAPEEFIRTEIVASGQISVPRGAFTAHGGVYREDLQTPAAEEFELSLRLRAEGIPVFLAARIVAVHRQALDIGSVARQQFKHGIGVGEVSVKCPETMALSALAGTIRTSGGRQGGRGPRELLKSALVSPLARRALLGAARVGDRLEAPRALQWALYRAAISSHFVAGVRRGLELYGTRQC